MKIKLLLASLLFIPTLAVAGPGITAKVSTLGLGAEVNLPLSDYIGVRLGLNNFSYGYDMTKDDIEYNFDLELNSTMLLLDYHPFGGNFRISAGIVKNNNEFQGDAASQNSYTVGGNTYTPQQIGTLTGLITFDDTAPYASIGWAQSLGSSGFGLAFEVGVLLQGEPKATLTATGALSDPQLQSDLQAEEAALEQDMSEFDTYPVISLGISYKF